MASSKSNMDDSVLTSLSISDDSTVLKESHVPAQDEMFNRFLNSLISKLDGNSGNSPACIKGDEDFFFSNNSLNPHISYFQWISTQVLNNQLAAWMMAIVKPQGHEIPVAEENPNLAHEPFCSISDLALLALLCIKFEKYEECLKYLILAHDYIHFSFKREYFNEGHCIGMTCVFKSLAHYLQFCSKELVEPSLLPTDDELKNVGKTYAALDNRSKAAILTMNNQIFRRLVRGDVEPLIQISKKIVELDSDHFEWHIYLYRHLRFQRMGNVPSVSPSFEEINAISTAVKLSNSNSAQSLLAQSQCIGDLHRFKSWFFRDSESEANDPIQLGQIILETNEQIVDFYKKQSEIILSKSEGCIGPVMSLFILFTRTLPPRYRDFSYAKMLLDQGFAINPASCSLESHLGSYYLDSQEKDLKAAKEHFYKAIEIEPLNCYFARKELLHILLNDPANNEEEFKAHMQVVMGLKDQTRLVKQIADLHFLNGLFHFMMGRKEEAMENWISVYELRPSSLEFHRLWRHALHYDWPTFRELRGTVNQPVISRIEWVFRFFRKWNLDREMEKKFAEVNRIIQEQAREAVKRRNEREQKNSTPREIWRQPENPATAVQIPNKIGANSDDWRCSPSDGQGDAFNFFKMRNGIGRGRGRSEQGNFPPSSQPIFRSGDPRL